MNLLVGLIGSGQVGAALGKHSSQRQLCACAVSLLAEVRPGLLSTSQRVRMERGREADCGRVSTGRQLAGFHLPPFAASPAPCSLRRAGGRAAEGGEAPKSSPGVFPGRRSPTSSPGRVLPGHSAERARLSIGSPLPGIVRGRDNRELEEVSDHTPPSPCPSITVHDCLERPRRRLPALGAGRGSTNSLGDTKANSMLGPTPPSYKTAANGRYVEHFKSGVQHSKSDGDIGKGDAY